MKEIMKFKFKKKHREEEMYQKLKKRLIKNGYVPFQEHITFYHKVYKTKYPYYIKVFQ